MSASTPSLLTAAHELAGLQHYPQGALYMVATPIGNTADITLRALQVLQLADTVACEDTRHTAGLLQAYGLHKPLLALHEHNEAEAAQTVVQRLQAGQRVAYVSDAGTPGVSDPGARLCAAVVAAGLRAIPLPGASSLTALLSVAGTGGHDGRFVFQGFLSPKATERQREVQALGAESRAAMDQVLAEVQGGGFVRDLMADYDAGSPDLMARRAALGRRPIEAVGVHLNEVARLARETAANDD